LTYGGKREFSTGIEFAPKTARFEYLAEEYLMLVNGEHTIQEEKYLTELRRKVYVAKIK
jgi:hypothetical protein